MLRLLVLTGAAIALASCAHPGPYKRGYQTFSYTVRGQTYNPMTVEQALDSKDPVSALISFALEPRAEGEDPCGGPLKIFDGRQLTHLHLTNHGMKQGKSEAWSGEAYECHIKMDKVAGYKESQSQAKAN